jgi:hypothetical protein
MVVSDLELGVGLNIFGSYGYCQGVGWMWSLWLFYYMAIIWSRLT